MFVMLIHYLFDMYIVIILIHFQDVVPRLANLLFLWIISFVVGGGIWAMVGDMRAGLLSFKEICLVTLSTSLSLLFKILDMSTGMYSTLFDFNNFYIPLPGSLIVLSSDSLFTGFGLCLGNINMIIPIDCCELFSGFICIVSEIN